MADKNHVEIEGNLTRDAEGKFLANGTFICNLSVAVNRSYKKAEEWIKETSYFDVDVWGHLGEDTADRAKKGVRIEVQGRLKQERWQTTSGDNRSKIKIVADKVLFPQAAPQTTAEPPLPRFSDEEPAF